jgi:hypothetical protein
LGLPFPCDYARLIIGGGTTGNAPRDHSNARTDLPLLRVPRQGDLFAIGALTPAVFLLFDRGASRNG